ncbi:MAG: Two-component system sensor histidine kinase [uncultured Nocardioidaceae bacterium]|uniref:histidine kinase n=1 Tax=uncultured Nocardioidaceae bacterium TaxID=253824 RepID=A0A6J4LVU1_9ACTN|nr:MAG: Two-component system sensor histidine kinase [uncultured Nocardioidaceae bacterium]
MTAPRAGAYRPGVEERLRTVGYDVLLFASLAATMVVELAQSHDENTEITPLSVAVVTLASAPVLLRHRHPALSLTLAMVMVYGVMVVVDIHQTVPFPSMVAGYCLALVSTRRQTVLAGLVLVPFVVGAIAVFGHEVLASFELPKNLAFVAAPLLLGSAVRERRATTEALVERAEEAERSREEEALRRVGEERLRIAREVHDVVAHAMVAINVQAGVGAHLLERDPAQAKQTLLDIKRVSGHALGDLRDTLGDLRSPSEGDPAPVQPSRGLQELEGLGASLRSAGLEVDLRIDPATETLPVALTATGYRIVQEALTNVVRHAHGAHARVDVTRCDDHVVIDVSDDGRGVPSDRRDDDAGTPAPGSGNGLRGSRERALALGGTFTSGPDPDGGWRVTATLPVAVPAASGPALR